MKHLLSLITLCIWCVSLSAQTIRDEWFIITCHFQAPLDGEMYVSGNFGEPRPNHYHAGLDLKTGSVENWIVRSAEDGFVSRIKISATGYGNALYIDHPCGLTTVYAHLNQFVPEIQEWVKKVQYQKQSFEIDTILTQKIFQLKRGEQIAFSGNTGGSAGPHLHFEVRETKSELVLNPMRFGFQVKDKTPPTVGELRVYPIQQSFFDTKGKSVSIKNTGSGKYQGADTEIPEGELVIAVQAFDRQDLTPENKNGIPELKMLVDGKLVFHRKMDTIDFSQTKYTHAMIDYCDKVKTGKDFYLATWLPGNVESRPFQNSPSNGKISLTKGEEKNIEILLIDYHGNTSSVQFKVKGVAPKKELITYLNPTLSKGQKTLPGAVLSWTNETFYDKIPDKVSVLEKSVSPFSATYYIFKNEVFPIHRGLELNVREWNFPDSLKDKSLLVGLNVKNRKKAFPTKWEGNNIISQIIEPSEVYLTVDTIAPKIQWLNYHKHTLSFSGNKIQVKISDDLSGIQSYAGYIQNQWVLFEYDAKNDLLTHTFDSQLKGEFELLLKVVDMKNNIAESVVKFKK